MKYRTPIHRVTRTLRPLAHRLAVACIALVFMTMGGAPSMDHSTHVGHHASTEQASASHDGAGSHAGHHAAPAEQGEEESPAAECTCVGPCQGGTAPSESRTTSYVVAIGEIRQVRSVAQAVRILDRDPTSHLLPFPNPPPSRV